MLVRERNDFLPMINKQAWKIRENKGRGLPWGLHNNAWEIARRSKEGMGTPMPYLFEIIEEREMISQDNHS